MFHIKSILAGILISMGCVTYLSCDNKYFGSFLFALGLYTIVIFGLNLFTGKIGYLSNSNKSNILNNTITIFNIWIYNFIGCLITATFIKLTRLHIDVQNLVSSKINDGYVSLLILGVFCGALMYIAVEGYKRINNPLIVILPVMVFILCGFEHCVADMFYFTYYLPNMSVFDYISKILCITLGNAIGGNIFNYVTRQRT